MLALVAASIAGGVATYLFTTRVVMKRFARWGIAGVDVHKPGKPKVPEMGGTALLFGTFCFVTVLALLGALTGELLSIFMAILIAGLIGVIDDRYTLNKRVKPALCALAGLPIVLMGTYPHELLLPLSVSFNIPTLYMILVPIALAVTANAINMFDVMNGVASGTSLIVLLTLVVTWSVRFILVGGTDVAFATGAALMLLPPAVVLFAFNRYPSRVFLGDTGTLALGAAIGAFVVVSGLEFPGVVVMMVPITNAFFSIFSHGGLFERSELKSRPISVGDDGRLSSNPDPSAPLTLTRIILLLGYEREEEVFLAYMQLTLVTAILSVLCGLLIWGIG